MMAVGAFNQVQLSLRWYVDNFSSIADWRATLAARPSVKGEIAILIGKREGAAVPAEISIEDAVRALEQEGVAKMDAIKRVAKERGLGKRDVYRLISE